MVGKSDLYPLINKYNENYAIEDICKWLELVAKSKKSYFYRSQYGFWSFLYECKKDVTLIIEKYFDLFVPNGIFLNKKILKNYFDKISELMLKYPSSLESYYYNFDNIQEFSNALYKKGKKEKIINKYLKNSDLNANVLEEICNDPHISPNELNEIDLINTAKEKHKMIIQEYEKEYDGIKSGYIVSIGDKKPVSDNPLYCVLFLNRKHLESRLNSAQILNVLLNEIRLVDNNCIFSMLTNKIDGLSSILSRKKYPGKSFDYLDYHYKDRGFLLLFREYILFLKKRKIHIFDVFNDYFNKCVSSQYYIYNFKDIKFNKKEIPKDNIREMIEKMDIIFKFFNVFAQDESRSVDIVDKIESVPRIGEIRSLIPKKYVYVNENSIMELWLEMKNNIYVFEKLNNNYSANVLESYEFTNMKKLFEKRILYIEDGIVKVGNQNLLLILFQLCRYGYIVYHKLNKNQQKIVDNWIDEGKANVYNRLFSKVEANYLNYYLNDTFVNGLELRNKYVHGSTNNYNHVQHENCEIIFMYLLVLIIFKLNDEFAYFKNNC